MLMNLVSGFFFALIKFFFYELESKSAMAKPVTGQPVVDINQSVMFVYYIFI